MDNNCKCVMYDNDIIEGKGQVCYNCQQINKEIREKPKFNMNKVVFAWNYGSNLPEFHKCLAFVMYDIGDGKYITLIERRCESGLFGPEDIEHAFNKIIKKHPTEYSLLQYWQDNFSGFNGK